MKNPFFIANIEPHPTRHLRREEKETRAWIFNEDTPTHLQTKPCMLLLNKRSMEKEDIRHTSPARWEPPRFGWPGRSPGLLRGERTWTCTIFPTGMAATATHHTWSLAHKHSPFSARLLHERGGGHLYNLEDPISAATFNFLLSGKRRACFWGLTLLGVRSHPTAETTECRTSAWGLEMLPGLPTTE